MTIVAPPFNSQNAAEMQFKSRKAMAAKKEAEQLRKETAKLKEKIATLTGDNFQQATLMRVRKQLYLTLDSLDIALEKKVLDTQDVDRLSRAVERLAEMERNLAGRPLPGSLRPNGRRVAQEIAEPMPETQAASVPLPTPEPIATPVPIPERNSLADVPYVLE